MSFLKNVVKKTSIVSLLHGSMSAYDKHRGIDEVHASDMTRAEEFCPKEYAIHHTIGKAKKGFAIAAPMRHTFDMGVDIGNRVCNEYLVEFALGDWKCASCNAVRSFQKKPKTGCDRQDVNCNWRYEEVRLKIPPITCGFDLFLDVGKPKARLIELKTIIKEKFVELKAPLAEHRLRTNLYLRMIAESPLEDRVETDIGHVLYIAKSYGNWNPDEGILTPFKEYGVERDDTQTDAMVARAAEYKTYRETGKIPKRICASATCKRAKTCKVVQECFSGKFKSGATI